MPLQGLYVDNRGTLEGVVLFALRSKKSAQLRPKIITEGHAATFKEIGKKGD